MTEPRKIPYKLAIGYGTHKVYISIKFHRGAELRDSNDRELGFVEKWDNEYVEFHLQGATLETHMARENNGVFEHVCRNGYVVSFNSHNGTMSVRQPEGAVS